jgi:L,D-transpeptidase YbiS
MQRMQVCTRSSPGPVVQALSPVIEVSLAEQRLVLRRDGVECGAWRVSTAAKGPGERRGSGCTPRGRHVVRAKIGAGLPPGAVLVGRRPTGEIWSPALAAAHPGRDWILTRILWLSGSEPGRNRLGEVDTMRRYVYIHGTPDTEPMGVPRSHGCVRMRNDDMLELFELTPVGTEVRIA